jgi:regulator of replication initiation timing
VSESLEHLIVREFARVNARLDGFDSQLSSLRAEVAGLREEVAGLRIRVDNLETKLDRVRTDVMDRVDRVQDSITRLSADIGVNMHSIVRVERMARSASDENRDLPVEVAQLFRMLRSLAEEVRILREGPKSAS